MPLLRPPDGAKERGLVKGAWNPLENDGDALRLAVKLRKFPSLTHDGRHIFCGYELTTGKRPCHAPILEPVEPDANASTRRAVVRAAAAIGGLEGEKP